MNRSRRPTRAERRAAATPPPPVEDAETIAWSEGLLALSDVSDVIDDLHDEFCGLAGFVFFLVRPSSSLWDDPRWEGLPLRPLHADDAARVYIATLTLAVMSLLALDIPNPHGPNLMTADMLRAAENDRNGYACLVFGPGKSIVQFRGSSDDVAQILSVLASQTIRS